MDKQPVTVTAAAPDDESVAKRTTSVYLPIPMLDELDEVAAEMDRPRTWVIQRAIEEWMARHRAEQAVS